MSVGFDAERFADQFFEGGRMAFGRPQLELGVARGSHLQQPVVAAVVQREGGDRLRVAAVEAFSEPENRGEHANRLAALPGEMAVAVVTALWRRAPMVPRQQGDDLDLLGIEAAEIAVLDQVVGVLVVTLVADMDADVVQDGAYSSHSRSLSVRPWMLRVCSKATAQARYLIGMFRPVIAALRQFDDAAAPHVGIPIGLRDLLAVAGVCRGQPLAQRNRRRDLTAGGARWCRAVPRRRAGPRARLEARNAALVEFERHQPLRVCAAPSRDAAISERVRRAAVRGEDPAAQDRPRVPTRRSKPAFAIASRCWPISRVDATILRSSRGRAGRS